MQTTNWYACIDWFPNGFFLYRVYKKEQQTTTTAIRKWKYDFVRLYSILNI